jgi:hypothetical protein
MTKPDAETHQQCAQRFIDLANSMKDEGTSINVVSAGMITATGLYASYVAAGNEGGLTESGIEKVAAVFKNELERIQAIKKSERKQ